MIADYYIFGMLMYKMTKVTDKSVYSFIYLSYIISLVGLDWSVGNTSVSFFMPKLSQLHLFYHFSQWNEIYFWR